MNVPDSMLPRNMNARILLNLMGYKMSALEVIMSCFSVNYAIFIDNFVTYLIAIFMLTTNKQTVPDESNAP